MKKIAFSLVAMTLLMCSSFAVAKNEYPVQAKETLDQIIATVNEEVITRSELNHAIRLFKLQLKQSNTVIPPQEILRKEVLDQLINKKIQLQFAKQAGIKISKTAVDQAIASVAQQNHIDVPTLYQQLTAEGMQIAEYRQEIQEQLTLQQLHQQEVVNRLSLSPEEMKQAAKQSQSTRQARSYQVDDIFIPFTTDNPSAKEIERAQKRADNLFQQLKNSQNIKQTLEADKQSQAQPAIEIKQFNFLSLAELPTAFVQTIAKMNIHSFADPIQAANGFHILYLNAIGTRNAPASNSKQIEEIFLQRKFEAALKDWILKLRSQAYIQIHSP